MKKILAALLVLALVAPAMAAVTISGADLGSGHLRITVAPTDGAVVRGIALALSNSNGAQIDATADVTATNFNTFIDYAFDNGGYVIGTGHAIADPAAAGVATLPASNFSLSAGYLDEDGDGTKGEGLTVNSFFDIYYTLSGNATIAIALDTLRGGVVGDTLGTVTISTPTVNLVGVVNYNLTTATANATAGTVTTPGIGVFSVSGTQNLVATANANWFFWKWTGDAVANPVAASTTINMDAAKSVTANFTFACQQFNFSKLTGAGTDNVVNLTDLNAMILWVNTYKTGATFVVTNTNANWNPNGPHYNMTKKTGAGTDNVVNISDLNSMIDFVNKRKTGSTFVVNCATCNCG